ncbi:hypothetical protein HN695_05950 [Candidatus Woesearchaeota archaeon]|jgi:hypothetical protein|nr:hypothetical protein [Candidatus Woesearchaeota archaeon]MBT5272576.1 hypothetical protein [Candidatus Woesearchaeota archaeon]MBT6040567.1 hypothetical protein [Candidatus Woesearchaeota archaeon]MBT6337128.1 hypothetical protein [Candidatus Woesearchaeota archaeon]MBT7927852.1 hypothetical protein [Candidatus Woesearchaeota archaeon]
MNLVKKIAMASVFLGVLGAYTPNIPIINNVTTQAIAQEKPTVFIKDFDEVLDKDEQKEKVRIGKDDSVVFLDESAFYVQNLDTNTEYKEVLGKRLTGILDDECKAVEYILKDFGQGSEDLVVVCYEKSEGMYKRTWAINVDDVCRVYAKFRKAGVIKMKSYLTTEDSMANVNTRKMSYNAAEELLNVLTNYLPNNEQRCENWKRFIQKNYGPTGPARQSR